MKQAGTGPAGSVETDQVTDQVAALIRVIGTDELGSRDLMQALGLSHRPTFRANYLNPALEDGWIERTQPDSPRSPTQRYRLTGKGRRWLDYGKIRQLEDQYTGKAGRRNESDG